MQEYAVVLLVAKHIVRSAYVRRLYGALSVEVVVQE